MTLKRWLPTFLAFPLGGLLAIETLGSFYGPTAGAAGGLLAGAIIGAGQWLAPRSSGVGPRWIAHTAAAMSAGMALAAAGGAAWALGWLTTSQVIVDAERGHYVFGSSGALLVTLLTGLVLRAILAAPARSTIAIAGA